MVGIFTWLLQYFPKNRAILVQKFFVGTNKCCLPASLSPSAFKPATKKYPTGSFQESVYGTTINTKMDNNIINQK